MENLVCLSGRERETFLPEGRLDAAKELLEPARLVDPEAIEGNGEWIEVLRECNPKAILAAWKTPKLPDDIREIAPNLEYVCYLPGSIRGLIPRSAIEEGLLVTNWSSSISRTISECALLMVLCCMRRVRYWTEEMHFNGGWKTPETETQSLFERNVGLHGLGLISQGLVKLLKPFGVQVSAYSPSVPDSIYQELGVKKSPSLEELFSTNEVIVELAALTPKNQGIVGEDLLRSIPQGGAFVNVGRGAVVDEEALARVARDRQDLQIALDVYGVEPLPVDSPFRGMKNALLLPHLGGPTIDRRCDAGDHGLKNIKRFLSSQELIDPIDLRTYDRSS